MGSSSKGSTTTTGTTTSAPWSGAQGNLTDLYGRAKTFAGQGAGYSPYSGPTYIAPNSLEMQGLRGIEATARQGNPMLGGLLSQGKDMFSGRGMAAPLQRIASGQDGITETGIGTNNPYLMQNLGTAASKATDATSAMFGASGRYGGGAHQGTVAEEVGNIYSQGLGAQMNADLDRRQQTQAANIANRGGASDQLMQGYGRLAAMAPGLNEMRYSDNRQLVDTGAALRGETQAENQSYIDQYNARQAAPRNALEWYSGIMNGAGSLGGSSTTTQNVPKGSAIGGILGGALAGGGMLANSGNPMAMGLGAGAGGLMGLFS